MSQSCSLAPAAVLDAGTREGRIAAWRIPRGAGAPGRSVTLIRVVRPDLPRTRCPRRDGNPRPGHVPAIPGPRGQPADSHVPPFYENFGRRLIKSPRIYLADPGLACHLLGIETQPELARSPFAGVLFEGFIASEIVKAQVNQGRRRELYYFRDEQGLEVDFLVPGPSGAVMPIECKGVRTVTPEMTASMRKLAEAVRRRRRRAAIDMVLVHQPSKGPAKMRAVAPGVRALAWPQFVADL